VPIAARSCGSTSATVNRVDAETVAAEGANAERPEFLVAHRDRLRGAPFKPGLLFLAVEIDIGLERRGEALVPVQQRGEQRKVARLERVEPGQESVGDLTFVDEQRGLPAADSQLCTVLDFAILCRIANCKRSRLVDPVDNVDELLRKEIKNPHHALPRATIRDVRPTKNKNAQPTIQLGGLDAAAACT
jgi:hypothetical protein